MKPILIIGSYLSPYVRKVLACLEVKAMAYEVDHIVPFFGDDRFSKLSPLRRIPVLVDGDLVLSNSSVICQYLEDKQPEPALFPRDIADRARARWLEEFADTRMGDVFIWRLFNQIAIRPSVWGEKGDREMVDRTLKEEIPTVLDYLEGEAPADGFRFGNTLSVADIAIAAFFRNAGWVRFQIDAARWPKTAGWIGRTLIACFRQASEDRGRSVARADRRAARRAQSDGRADQRRDLRRLSTAPWRDADLVLCSCRTAGLQARIMNLERAWRPAVRQERSLCAAHPSLRLRPCRRRADRRRGRRRHARCAGGHHGRDHARGRSDGELDRLLVEAGPRGAGLAAVRPPSPTR